jgi:hypothetical protein
MDGAVNQPRYQLEGSPLFGYRVFDSVGVKSFDAASEKEAFAIAARLMGVHQREIARRTLCGFRYEYTIRPSWWAMVKGWLLR